MSKIKIFTLVGGISQNSLNKKYFEAIKDLELSQFEFTTFDIAKLPYFSQDLEKDLPASVQEFKNLITESDAILFITPEYNRSFPGVLKNAIDWGSRPYGTSAWKHKPAAILGASTGSVGTFGAQQHLRQSLAYLDVHVLGQPEIYFGHANKAFNEKNELINEKTEELLQIFFETFEDWITQINRNKDFVLGTANQSEQAQPNQLH